MSVIAPLFIGELLGKPLRFYPAPKEGPRFPYVVESDLAKALSMSRQHRRIMEALHGEDIMRGAAKVIKTERKLETIVSYTTARALINSVEMSRLKAKGEIEQANAIHNGGHTTPLEWSFIAEVKKVMDRFTASMSDDEGFAFFLEAHANETGGDA